jgi:hypothetical protein
MKKGDVIERGLDMYCRRKPGELSVNTHSLRTEIEEFKNAEEALQMAEKELREMRRYKEAELGRLIVQRQLISNKFL